ncbi:MAG: anthranilate phosphoribosyltransferase [Chthoniobacterales bacterium]
MDSPLAKALLIDRELQPLEIPVAAKALLSVNVDDATKARFLRAARERGETVNELAGFVEAFLDCAVDPQLELDPNLPTLDICGTGGDNLQLFNVSTAAMFVLAAGDVTVLKHGNRAITSKSGGADVLEALGIQIEASSIAIKKCVAEAGCGFLFAPAFHPSFKTIGRVRRQLASEGLTTMFNLLGPLLNPARPTHQLVGIFDGQMQEKYAAVLQKIGRKAAWVVHGTTADGRSMDELSTLGPSRVFALENGEMRRFTVQADVREVRDLHSLRGGDARANAVILEKLLRGNDKLEPLREIVSLNAGAGFVVTGAVPDLKTGIEKAWKIIESGAAWQRVEALRKLSRG